MTNQAKIRHAHRIIEDIIEGYEPTLNDIKTLRSCLPEPPKQKTLTELRHEVNDAWVGADGNEWPDDAHGVLETWLLELHEQLQGLENAAKPAKPAHPEFLETEADYQNAPAGTVVIREGGYPWTRIFDSWVAYSRNDYSHSEMAALRGKSRVLRWAVGNEQL